MFGVMIVSEVCGGVMMALYLALERVSMASRDLSISISIPSVLLPGTKE